MIKNVLIAFGSLQDVKFMVSWELQKIMNAETMENSHGVVIWMIDGVRVIPSVLKV